MTYPWFSVLTVSAQSCGDRQDSRVLKLVVWQARPRFTADALGRGLGALWVDKHRRALSSPGRLPL